ncbi:ubiquitin-like protein 7 [Macrosteles quadrilineatus]|uniref:ubiquitin-like protein 7 n=1 Tax=Macrosteles quadrilineatus TaxID=74068 RepID=UPI0023E1DE8C|nr:ubiquitin-like protein 7 [Macrosteles quadrilineatus]
MANVVLGIRLSLFDFQRVKVDEVDLQTKVEKFKIDVSEKANLPKESLELVYCGNILDDDSTLHACGIKSGVMIHVLKKKAKELPKPTQTMSEVDIQNLVMAFRALTMNPSYRSSLQKLSRPDILDNIVQITPGLSQDPVAISMIQDSELLVRMGDIDTVRRIVELHPALAEAANHIAAAVHEEAITASATTQPTTSSGYSYSLDALSDDEEMDSSQSSDSQPANRHAITAAQLASALASANSPSPGALQSQDGGGITSEMFNQAMQRAIASVVGQPGTPAPEADAPEGGAGTLGQAQLAQQMQQMRELGLTDDAVNLQALQLAQGNLHAAVDLVFSGAISPP